MSNRLFRYVVPLALLAGIIIGWILRSLTGQGDASGCKGKANPLLQNSNQIRLAFLIPSGNTQQEMILTLQDPMDLQAELREYLDSRPHFFSPSTITDASDALCRIFGRKYGLTIEEARILLNWRKGHGAPYSEYEKEAAQMGNICLAHELNRAAIVNLLGPTYNENYSICSQLHELFFKFNNADELVNIYVLGKPLRPDVRSE